MIRAILAALFLATAVPVAAMAQATVKFGYQPTAPIATFIAARGTGAAQADFPGRNNQTGVAIGLRNVF